MKNYIYQFVSNREWDFPSLDTIFENTRHLGKQYLHLVNTNGKDHFEQKVVMITGASSGIGRAMAFEFASRGAKVVLAARSIDKLEELAGSIRERGGIAFPVPTDVTDENQCRSLVEITIKTFGRIDILVNNAGISMRANFSQVDLSVLKKLMDTNFWGSVYCTRYALPYLVKQEGSLIGISSICGITPLPGRTGYTASKHALDGFLETIRLENYENGLHVMLVHPGFTNSNIRNLALNRNGLPQVETPLDEDKLMSAEEVAREVAVGIVERKRDIILTTEGKLITWLYRHAPAVADRIIYREMKKEVGAPF